MQEKAAVFGLIGRRLGHSWSRDFFTAFFAEQGFVNYTYRNFELGAAADILGLIQDEPLLCGLNVTVPYKQEVIKFLDDLDGEAREIGAVNCIVIKNGRTTGFNADAYGFEKAVTPLLAESFKKALILGTGGSAQAVAFVMKKLGIEFGFVTSSEKKRVAETFHYSELSSSLVGSHHFIVNCTPLGMWPNTEGCPPLPWEAIGSKHLMFDLVYNPPETVFLKRAKAQGASVSGGLEMLRWQALRSWEIWQEQVRHSPKR